MSPNAGSHQEAPDADAPRERGRFRRIGLRWRITIAFLGAALAVSAIVSGTTYILVERYLAQQRVDESIQQAFGSLRFAQGFIETQPQEAEALGDLVRLLGDRGVDALIVSPQEETFASSFGITDEAIPSALRGAVREGRVGYAYTIESPTRLVFGTPIPRESGYEAYFFFPLGDLEQTLTILRNVLLAVSAGAVGMAALAGTRVSRRVVDPVRRASRAARRVAEGLLETRLPEGGRDELAALARSFNEMAEALEERIARERRFVSDVSHELRTPLTTLRTSTDYLLEHAEILSPQVRRAAELLAADLVYLQRLVDDLLHLSRMEAGRVDMAWERISMADLVREVVARRVRSGDQVVRVELDAPPDALVTMADKQRLERVVANLVDNALTHGGGGGVTVRLGATDGTLVLSVEDLGPGIPVEASERIFERFYKADTARQRDERRGSGLGLAIARENAHLHGGEIEVDNGGRRGARFVFRIPQRHREPEP
jgi:two-component system, OmpR family, sensor histidine kinase MtrB